MSTPPESYMFLNECPYCKTSSNFTKISDNRNSSKRKFLAVLCECFSCGNYVTFQANAMHNEHGSCIDDSPKTLNASDFDKLAIYAYFYFSKTKSPGDEPWFFHNIYKKLTAYPINPELGVIPSHIPNTVEKAIEGALQCIQSGVDSKFVLFGCRSALETAMKDKQPNKSENHNLASFIKDYDAPQLIKDWADNIRLFGNKIHNKDYNITNSEAIELFEFTCIFLQYAYTLPYLVLEKQKSLEKKKNQDKD